LAATVFGLFGEAHPSLGHLQQQRLVFRIVRSLGHANAFGSASLVLIGQVHELRPDISQVNSAKTPFFRSRAVEFSSKIEDFGGR
jgi:hypothetical protein